MTISRSFIKAGFGLVLCAAVLAACGGKGVMPTPTEQTELEAPQPASLSTQSVQTRFGRGFGHMLGGITLSDAQQTQMKALIAAFRQVHPRGSAFDPEALRTLHERLYAVLTPAQQAQFEANVQARAMHRGAMWRLNLSDQQRAQIRSLVQTFRTAHPRGSAPDPQARAELRAQIRAVLTPEQRIQLDAQQPH